MPKLDRATEAALRRALAEMEAERAALDVRIDGVRAALGLDMEATAQTNASKSERYMKKAYDEHWPEIQEAMQQLGAMDEENAVTQPQIAELTGIAAPTVSRAIRRALELGQVIRVGRFRFHFPARMGEVVRIRPGEGVVK